MHNQFLKFLKTCIRLILLNTIKLFQISKHVKNDILKNDITYLSFSDENCNSIIIPSIAVAQNNTINIDLFILIGDFQ